MKEITTHFIGIGGIGMSALARLLLLQNRSVSGSDLKSSPLIEELTKLGANISLGHDAKNLPVQGNVVISTDIKSDNIEWSSCNPDKHNVLHRSEMLRDLMQGQKALLVSGTHGKTTTSSLLATVLTEAGKNPSWAVGGLISHYGTNSGLGGGDYFVAEADESDGTHLKYTPWGLIVTNIDSDHLNFFKTKDAIKESLKALIFKAQSTSHLFWCGDDTELRNNSLPGYSYGFRPENHLLITDFRQEGAKSYLSISFEGQKISELETNLIGRHNALNTAAVIGMALKVGVSETDLRKGLKLFKGVKRRAEVKSNLRETIIIDDYAHHPTELAATLEGIKKAYPRQRLIVAFQPHRYSRTKDCFHEFGPALKLADQILITDIYSAGEAPIAGVDSQELSKIIDKSRFVARSKLVEELSLIMRPFDVVIFMGAGDITQASNELARHSPRKLKLALVFGGKSDEHEISFLSARNISRSFDPDLIEVELYAISKKGQWISGESAYTTLWQKSSLDSSVQVDEHALALQKIRDVDLAFPLLHGPYGEDGMIQGFFEILGLPYVGSNVESSALAMNKATTKKVAAYKGIPVVEFIDFTTYEWQTEPESLIQTIEMTINYPVFVKPVHLGSTIGVKKAKDRTELKQALESAFRLDHHVIVERAVVGREIECSVVGRGPWFVSNPGEICSHGNVYGYEDKYGANSFEVKVQADLSDEEIADAKHMALSVYKALLLDGMARVDLFLEEGRGFLLNEVNPVPGCTNNSLFPKMCEASGLTTADLLTRLVRLSLERNLGKALYATVS